MSRCVVLDAEALVALAGRPGRRSVEVRAALRAAERLRREVVYLSSVNRTVRTRMLQDLVQVV